MSSHRDSLRQGGARFVMVEHGVFDDFRVKPTTLAVYCGLMMYANEDGYCFPSRSKMAARVGVSVSTVRSAIVELEAMGLVRCYPRYNDLGEQMSNEYVVYRPSDPDRPDPAPDPDSGLSEPSGESQGCVTITDRGVNSTPPGVQNLHGGGVTITPLNKNQLTSPIELENDVVSQRDTDATITPSEGSTQGDAPAPDPEELQPYRVLERVSELQGADMSVWTRQQLGRQLSVVKRMIADGVTLQEFEACTGWLASQSWVRSVDMFLIERKLGEFRIARARTGSAQPGSGMAKRGMSPEEFFGDYYHGGEE